MQVSKKKKPHNPHHPDITIVNNAECLCRSFLEPSLFFQSWGYAVPAIFRLSGILFLFLPRARVSRGCVSPSLRSRPILTSITPGRQGPRSARWGRQEAEPWSRRSRSCRPSSASESPGSWTGPRWTSSRGLAAEFPTWQTIASSQVNPNGKKIL